MKISKYRMIDIILSILICITGLIGYLIIPTVEKYNIFLIIYVLLNVCLFPICFYFMLKNRFFVCVFVPIALLLALVNGFYRFEVENKLVWDFISICVVISIVLSTCTTIFVHSRKTISEDKHGHSMTNNLLFKKNVLKRFGLYIRDSVIVFAITAGIVFYSNIAFDTSNIVEFEVVVVDMDERSWKHDRILNIKYTGNDPRVAITNLHVPNHIADEVSPGDKLLLQYREGSLGDPYFWIATIIE